MGIRDRMQSFSFSFEREDGSREIIQSDDAKSMETHRQCINETLSGSLPSTVRYIKLGSGGSKTDEICISQGFAYIGFGTLDDKLFGLAKARMWDDFRNLKFESDFAGSEQARKQRATSATNQVKAFFEADEKTLWITFMQEDSFMQLSQKNTIRL